jgi:hypothetical protein
MAVTVTLRLTSMEEAENLISALYDGAALLDNAHDSDSPAYAESLRRLAEDIINVTP